MTRLRSSMGKDHRPVGIACTAEQLAIDEIGDAPEEKPDRYGCRYGIADFEKGDSAPPGEQRHGDQHAEQAAMEGHAALPDRQNFAGMGEVEFGAVEEDVTEPSAPSTTPSVM